jgi:hypothetical protein
MFSPPITSRRFSTTSRSASMKACSRAASRVTSCRREEARELGDGELSRYGRDLHPAR